LFHVAENASSYAEGQKLQVYSAVVYSLQLSGRMRSLLNYEAPEFQDSGVVSERGDVYSFGVVMLELLTGRKPYDR